MGVKLATEDIFAIKAFENVTKVHAQDCLITEDCVYFLVNPEKVGVAIGRNGALIKEARRVLGRPVKVFGIYPTAEAFLYAIIPEMKLSRHDDAIMATISEKDKTAFIGRNGSNIKAIREILKRHFGIKTLKVR